MARAGRAAGNEQVERDRFCASHRANRAHQFEVLEHDASVVATCVLEHRATHPKSARPVASGETVEERASRVVTGVPGQRIEVVLWPDDVVVVEEGYHAVEGVGRVSYI